MRISLTALSLALSLASSATAQGFTAGDVIENMPPEQRAVFFSGVVEGYAYGAAQASQTELARCGLAWYYGTDEAVLQFDTAFRRYPDRRPAEVVAAVIQLRCSE